jgi:hypothetical protein
MLSIKQNLGKPERVASGLVGGALASLALGERRHPAIAVPALASAVYLWLRAFTGHCAIYEHFALASLGGGLPRRRIDLVAKFEGETLDIVDHGSELSFPASDPPAHSRIG